MSKQQLKWSTLCMEPQVSVVPVLGKSLNGLQVKSGDHGIQALLKLSDADCLGAAFVEEDPNFPIESIEVYQGVGQTVAPKPQFHVSKRNKKPLLRVATGY